MSAVLKCDGCGTTTDPRQPRRYSDAGWLTVTDGMAEQHACSPRCLVAIGEALERRLSPATQDAE